MRQDKDHWMEEAVKPASRGKLRKALDVPEGQKIPGKVLRKAAHSADKALAKEARLAETFKKFKPR